MRRLCKRLQPEAGPAPRSGAHLTLLFGGQLLISVYGGYSGAGMGILMLAALGLFGLADFHERDAIKNLLSAVTNGLASIFFIFAGAIRWDDGLALGAGSIMGGLVGASVGRRLPNRVLEGVAIAVGVIATASLLLRRR